MKQPSIRGGGSSTPRRATRRNTGEPVWSARCDDPSLRSAGRRLPSRAPRSDPNLLHPSSSLPSETLARLTLKVAQSEAKLFDCLDGSGNRHFENDSPAPPGSATATTPRSKYLSPSKVSMIASPRSKQVLSCGPVRVPLRRVQHRAAAEASPARVSGYGAGTPSKELMSSTKASEGGRYRPTASFSSGRKKKLNSPAKKLTSATKLAREKVPKGGRVLPDAKKSPQSKMRGSLQQQPPAFQHIGGKDVAPAAAASDDSSSQADISAITEESALQRGATSRAPETDRNRHSDLPDRVLNYAVEGNNIMLPPPPSPNSPNTFVSSQASNKAVFQGSDGTVNDDVVAKPNLATCIMLEPDFRGDETSTVCSLDSSLAGPGARDSSSANVAGISDHMPPRCRDPLGTQFASLSYAASGYSTSPTADSTKTQSTSASTHTQTTSSSTYDSWTGRQHQGGLSGLATSASGVVNAIPAASPSCQPLPTVNDPSLANSVRVITPPPQSAAQIQATQDVRTPGLQIKSYDNVAVVSATKTSVVKSSCQILRRPKPVKVFSSVV